MYSNYYDVALFVVVNRTWMTALLESVCYLTKEVIKRDVSNFIGVKLCMHTYVAYDELFVKELILEFYNCTTLQ